MVMESSGAVGPAFETVFNNLITLMVPIYNIGPSALKKYWTGRISIAMQRANAQALFIKGRKVAYMAAEPGTFSHNEFAQEMRDSDNFSSGGGLGRVVNAARNGNG